MADQFPKTLYVTGNSDGDYFGRASLDEMNDGNGANDGEEIAVYELSAVKRAEVTRTLVDAQDQKPSEGERYHG